MVVSPIEYSLVGLAIAAALFYLFRVIFGKSQGSSCSSCRGCADSDKSAQTDGITTIQIDSIKRR